MHKETADRDRSDKDWEEKNNIIEKKLFISPESKRRKWLKLNNDMWERVNSSKFPAITVGHVYVCESSSKNNTHCKHRCELLCMLLPYLKIIIIYNTTHTFDTVVFYHFHHLFFSRGKNHVYLSLYTAIDKLLANNLLKQLNGAASGPISQRRGFCHNQHAKQNKIVTA